MRSTWEGVCIRCSGAVSHSDLVVLRKGHWIHAACASGGDDE